VRESIGATQCWDFVHTPVYAACIDPKPREYAGDGQGDSTLKSAERRRPRQLVSA
jgi:hypothetical protein